ncbi:restriction endonuclease subunit S [Vibrio scophthalmi]|uniref:restriction endonuclease subunit S n=1 Tax=Vibrio scophthalmi TaxID=45658 RepID=UPI002FEEE503
MSCNWPIVKLGDYCSKIGSGATPKGGNSVYLDNGEISLIRSQNIYNDGFKSDGLAYITPEAAQKLKNVIIEPNDVLINITGDSVARVCLAPNEFLPARVNQHVAILRVVPEEFEHRYLRYYLTSTKMQNYLLTIASTGGTRNALTKLMLESLAVSKPPLNVQKKIGDVLEQFENKILINTKTNQTLEQMAQAIFKSWFVDFDPVKAKMNGEQPEGMDAATASLFPEKLVESELGLIPEGWEVGTLDTHTSMIIDHRGKTPKKLGSDWVEEGYPAISAKNIKSKKIVRPDTIRFIDEATYKKWMKEPLIKGDIIMTSEAPMGELYFFDGSQDFCLSQRLYGLRANSDICSPEFLFNWLQTTKAKADMEGRASGTTALGIKQAELRKVKILTPPRELLEQYSVVASNLVDMAAKNNAQNTTLEALRDTLLPKLLSGEIELGQSVEVTE